MTDSLATLYLFLAEHKAEYVTLQPISGDNHTISPEDIRRIMLLLSKLTGVTIE